MCHRIKLLSVLFFCISFFILSILIGLSNPFNNAEINNPLSIVIDTFVAIGTLAAAFVMYLQLRLFKQQLKIMGSTIEDAKKSADAANKSAETAQETLRILRSEIRPWIQINSIDAIERTILSEKNYSIPLRIRLQNVGKTPAVNVRASCQILCPAADDLGYIAMMEKIASEERSNSFSGLSIFPSSRTYLDAVASMQDATFKNRMDGVKVITPCIALSVSYELSDMRYYTVAVYRGKVDGKEVLKLEESSIDCSRFRFEEYATCVKHRKLNYTEINGFLASV